MIEAPDFRISDEPDLRLLRQNPSPRKLYKEAPAVDEVILRNYAKKKSKEESQGP